MHKRLAFLFVAGLLVLSSAAEARPKAECNPRRINPQTCAAIWRDTGMPAYASPASGKIAICHDRYIVSHDNASKTPDWVMEVLTKARLTNKFKRPQTGFSPDLCVPKEFSATAGDYAKTADKFEIGHMAPSEDFNNSAINMRDTFVFSNAVPQAGDTFNAAIWRSLETEVRNAAIARNKLYVITGPIRGNGGARKISIAKADNACGHAIELETFKARSICKAVNTGQATECSNGVVVPVAVYKIAYDPAANAAYAYVMANRNYETGLGRPFLEESRVNVGAIEKLTGLKFFAALPDDKRAALIDGCEPSTLWLPPAPKAPKKKKPA